MFKNVASQKAYIFVYDTVNKIGKTGDAANITAYISKDGAAPAQTNDVNPTEIDATNMKGHYYFDLTQAESNADAVLIVPTSSTADMQVEPVLVYTNPPNYTALGIESDGDITKVNTLDGHTAQTGDSYAVVNSGTFGNSALKTLIDALNDVSSADILTTALVEAYGTKGAARTLTQMLYEILAQVSNFSIAGTTKTTKKVDTSTVAKTYTLDDANDPTSLTEAT